MGATDKKTFQSNQEVHQAMVLVETNREAKW